MRIVVGKYELNGEYGSQKEAVESFMAIFPAATKEDVEKKVKELFKTSKDADKSRNVTVENTESQAGNPDTGKRGAGKKQSGED